MGDRLSSSKLQCVIAQKYSGIHSQMYLRFGPYRPWAMGLYSESFVEFLLYFYELLYKFFVYLKKMAQIPSFQVTS